MRNVSNTPVTSSSRTRVPSRRTGVVAAIASAIMSMTAASSARAGDVIFGIGNDIKRGGAGGRGGMDATARASAEAATKAVEAAIKRLEATEAGVAAAAKAATAAADTATAALNKLRELEGRLAALEAGGAKKPADPAAPPRGRDLPADGTATDAPPDKGAGERTPPPTPAREPTDEEIVAAAAAARGRLEAKAAVAEAKRIAAEAEVQARRAQEVLLRAQAQKAQAAADLAQAIADQKAAKLAEAQAAANAANAQAAGLNGEARAANVSLDSVRQQLRDAEDKARKAQQEAQDASRVIASLNGGNRFTVTRPTPVYTPVTYDGPTPTFFGEVIGNVGLNSGNDFRGGIEAAGFARVGEHVALGLRTEFEGGTRMVRMGGGQNVLGSSSGAGIMGALQLGTVGGENGANLELAGGALREAMIGVANGADGSTREGAISAAPRLKGTIAGYMLVSPNIRFKAALTVDMTAGRPAQLGGDARENVVGVRLGMGISTK